MTEIAAYASFSPGTELKPYSYKPARLGPQSVEIKVSTCGICYSDVAMLNNDWGISQYPLVPGHEIVGEVQKVGKKVSKLKPGDKVGVGWFCSSCGQCHDCDTKLY